MVRRAAPSGNTRRTLRHHKLSIPDEAQEGKKTQVNKTETEWIKVQTEVDTYDWKGHPIHLQDVPALKNPKTGKIRIYPYEVARAELAAYAKAHGLEPRDIATLLMLYAKPGPFPGGIQPLRYRLNKSLFYQWKENEKHLLGESLPRDNFVAAPRGPIPENLNGDLDRMKQLGIVDLKFIKWGEGELNKSMTIMLTEKGTEIAKSLWNKVPEPFLKVTLKVKERIFPLDSKTIRERVHREYPDYKLTYTELDTD